MKLLIVLLIQCLTSVVHSQTTTVTNADGNTVIQFITTDPANGLATTSIIQTLTPTTTTAAPPVLTTDPQQGPVGQPAPTIPGQITSYRYTTTDANGQTIVLSDIFTPSFPPTQPIPAPTTTGSILQLSEWLSLVGTNTVPVPLSNAEPWRIPTGAYKIVAGLVSALMGGAMLVIL